MGRDINVVAEVAERLEILTVGDEEDVASVEALVRGRIDQAVKGALDAPYPDPAVRRAREFAA